MLRRFCAGVNFRLRCTRGTAMATATVTKRGCSTSCFRPTPVRLCHQHHHDGASTTTTTTIAQETEVEVISLSDIEFVEFGSSTTTTTTSGGYEDANNDNSNDSTSFIMGDDSGNASAVIDENPRGDSNNITVGSGGDDEYGSGSSGQVSARSQHQQHHHQDITCVDPFSRSKLINFVRRVNKLGASESLTHLFETTADDSFASLQQQQQVLSNNGANSTSSPTLYRCQVRIVFPNDFAQFGVKIAEGCSDNEKDAEILAAMHAERIIDVLGIPLFALSSRQKKHAEAARAAGRWAPMPGDAPRNPAVDLPPPLRMVSMSFRAMLEQRSNNNSNNSAAADGSSSSSSQQQQQQSQHRANEPQQQGERGKDSTSSSSSFSTQQRGDETSSATPQGFFSLNSSESQALAYRAQAAMQAPKKKRFFDTPDPFAEVSKNAQAAALSNNTDKLQSLLRGEVSPHIASVGGMSDLFDPSEGGTYQIVNTTSTRCSCSPHTLILPGVLEKQSLDRIKKYFRHYRLEFDNRKKVSHVMVQGYASRVYVVDLLVEEQRNIVARGKAGDETMALHLAAMHAELLVDFHGLPLFPYDAKLQAQHAADAHSFGRWAVEGAATNNTTPEIATTIPENIRTTTFPYPLPLKQYVFTDDTLELASMSRCATTRTLSERFISLHHLAYAQRSDIVDVWASEAERKEAFCALTSWLKRQGSRYYGQFMCTRMGEKLRCSVLFPLPESFTGGAGVRCGNGAGRTQEQAKQMACLQGIETLCSLGIDVYDTEPEKSAVYWDRRRALGHPTPFDSPNSHSSPSSSSTSSSDASQTHDASKSGGGGVIAARVPHLPLYYLADDHASIARAPPRPDDLRYVVSLPLSKYQVLRRDAQTLLTSGTEQKAAIQLYCTKCRGSSNVTEYPVPTSSVVGNSVSASNSNNTDVPVSGIQIQRDGYNSDFIAHNSVYLPIYLPKRLGGGRFIALGVSGKRKDADRACFLHARAILDAHGVDPVTEPSDEQYTTEAARKKKKGDESDDDNTSSATSATNDSSSSGSGVVIPAPFMHPSLETNMKTFVYHGGGSSPAKKKPPQRKY